MGGDHTDSQNTPYPFEIIHIDPVYPSDKAASEHLEEIRKLLLALLGDSE